MRIFLDTNVILTGAFNCNGPAGTLNSLLGRTTFIYSPKVLAECGHIIGRDSPTQNVAFLAERVIHSYLNSLNAIQVPDSSPPQGISAVDKNDDLILGAALSAKADVICTYNIKDFPEINIHVKTPLSIHRLILKPRLEQYIQPIRLSECGTLLFFGRLHHESSMGEILNSDSDVAVTADERGFIRLIGSSVKRCSLKKPLRGNTEFRLTLRYNFTDFEAALWSNDSGAWKKEIITTGAAIFSKATKPILWFAPNHRFSGHIQCISGLPRFVRDKQLLAALDNYSLEASAESLDLKDFLRTAVFR